MAVARHRKTAARMPNHMPCAASGAPYEAWMKNVSHRNAPGAISAIAFEVRPVNPSVVGGFVGVSAAMHAPSSSVRADGWSVRGVPGTPSRLPKGRQPGVQVRRVLGLLRAV